MYELVTEWAKAYGQRVCKYNKTQSHYFWEHQDNGSSLYYFVALFNSTGRQQEDNILTLGTKYTLLSIVLGLSIMQLDHSLAQLFHCTNKCSWDANLLEWGGKKQEKLNPLFQSSSGIS